MSESPGVVSCSNARHYAWGDACDGWHLLESADLSVIEERVPAGASESRHVHSRARQCFYVLEGAAVIERGGEEFVLTPGQSLEVPAGTPHCFFNRSNEPVRFLAISQPPSHGDRSLA